MSAWLHGRKGRIVGEVVGQDDTWTQIRLSEDAWADVRRRHMHAAGSVQTYRTEFLVPVQPDDSEAGTMSAATVWMPFPRAASGGYESDGVHVTASEVRDRIGSPPLYCTWEVSRAGQAEPCMKPAVALRYDENNGGISEVCKYHAKRVLVPLEFIVKVAEARS